MNRQIDRFICRTVGLMALLVAISGCSDSDRPDMGEVVGTVTRNGVPLVGAEVEFYPVGEAAPSYGKTDSQGRFELYYSTGPRGAAIGQHKVTILGGSLSASAVPAEIDDSELAESGADNENRIPVPVQPPPDAGGNNGAPIDDAGSSQGTTGIVVEVKPGNNDLTIEVAN